MTGTGKIDDPYIPDNWDDFVTAVGESGANVEFPEGGGVIDLNNYAPTGISPVDINCASIKGNGWKIYNLYYTGQYSQQAFVLGWRLNVSITDLHFLDMNVDDRGMQLAFFYSNDSTYRFKFERCSFSGIFSGSNTNSYIFHSGMDLKRCSTNICCNGKAKLIRNKDSTLTSAIYDFCNIKLSGDSDDVLQNTSFVNCYFTGNSVDTGVTVTKGPAANYNIFNVDFTGAEEFSCKGNPGAVNLINTDLLPPGAVIGTGFVGVTTDQLRNAAYLAELGFPIGVD